MKKTFLAVIAAICSLTAIGQAPQYLNDWLLTSTLKNGCTQIPFELFWGGWESRGLSDGNEPAYAQPYFIDSTISVKGIALMATFGYYVNEIPTSTDSAGYYLQIRDEKIDGVLASVRYDTATLIRPLTTWGGDYHNLNNYVELLFDSSIFITSHKFYTVMTLPPNHYSHTTSFHSSFLFVLSFPSCYSIIEPPSVLENGQWHYVIPYTVNVPGELCLFPILDTLTYNGGLSQVNLDNLTYLYPNPATKEITFASSIGLTKIEIINVIGQKVYEQETKANSITIDVSNFARGNYVAKIHTSKGVTTKKFVVE